VEGIFNYSQLQTEYFWAFQMPFVEFITQLKYTLLYYLQ